MDLNLLISIFTIAGATLGIVAFVQNFLNPFFEHNKIKWKELNEIISLNDFENLVRLYTTHIIPKNSNFKLEELIELIKNDSERLKFKTIFINGYRKRLRNIYYFHKKYIELASVLIGIL